MFAASSCCSVQDCLSLIYRSGRSADSFADEKFFVYLCSSVAHSCDKVFWYCNCGFLLMGSATAVIPALDDLLQLYVSQMIGGFGRGLVFPLLMSFSVATMAPGAKATAMGALS